MRLRILTLLTVYSLLNLRLDASPLDDLSSLYNTKNEPDDAQCRYLSCPRTDPSKINVHIIAHTHDDVGWLKTVDQYYYGSKKRYNMVGVSYILDSIIPELVMDRSKRFIYVEISFFSKWWAEQNDKMKSIVRQLVNEGRLEFINGGWCMNDEATTRYQSIIEQMTLGLKFLNETFGSCGHPKVGWQIDPFGHSNEQASLFAQFGYDGMYFTRMSFQEKKHRAKQKSLDLIWHGDRALEGQVGSIFTSIFKDGYDSPIGYCFDVQCFDDPIIDNPNSYEYNIKSKAEGYIRYIKDLAKVRLTNHILIPFGGDFQFSAANQNFKNMDRLISYISKNESDLKLFYSTPTCYQQAVYNTGVEKKIKWPEKYDDFMPYESSPSIWWTGYFSSRPSVKLIEREATTLLQVVRLASFRHFNTGKVEWWSNRVKNHEKSCLNPIWEVVGDLQHHDAVTGTEKQHVADDYVRRASDVSSACAIFYGDIRRYRLDLAINKTNSLYIKMRESGKSLGIDPIYLEKSQLCPLLNISQCSPIEAKVSSKDILKNLPQNLTITLDQETIDKRLETKSVLMTVYNPLPRPIQQHDFRIPCNEPCDLDKIRIIHVFTNESLKVIRLPTPAGITRLPFRESLTNWEILFYADLPSFGYTTFLIEDLNEDGSIPTDSSTSKTPSSVSLDEKSSRLTRDLKKSHQPKYQYFTIASNDIDYEKNSRSKRDAWDNEAERVVVKFDTSSGVIVGLRRATDQAFINVTQRFGYYFPTKNPAGGAYIFRVNSSEPIMLDKPEEYKIYRRKNSRLIEIHQKWNEWIWQTMRLDSKKSYIEFDYVIGPIPITSDSGKEVIISYDSSIENGGAFLTDSNSRQMLLRKSMEYPNEAILGGAFYPVTSTIALRNIVKRNNSAEFLAIFTDRSQAGTSLRPGHLELLVHRRLVDDDNFGVREPLNEPGEDGNGLVTRGTHRLSLKFTIDTNAIRKLSNIQDTFVQTQDSSRPAMYVMTRTPLENITFAKQFFLNNYSHPQISEKGRIPDTYIVHDPVLDTLRQDSVKYALKPVMFFDRLRISADEFFALWPSSQIAEAEYSLLNGSLPNNVHILTCQTWALQNTILLRFENLDNPLTLHPFPDVNVYKEIYDVYQKGGGLVISDEDYCGPRVDFNVEYLFDKIRITRMEELGLGGNVALKDMKRLDWSKEALTRDLCDKKRAPNVVSLGPRQIRTYLARYDRTD